MRSRRIRRRGGAGGRSRRGALFHLDTSAYLNRTPSTKTLSTWALSSKSSPLVRTTLAILPGSSEPSVRSRPRKRAGWIVRAFRAASLASPALMAVRTARRTVAPVGAGARDQGEIDALLGQLRGVGRVDLGLGLLAQILALGRVVARRRRPEIEADEERDGALLERVGVAPGFVGLGQERVELELVDDLQGPLDVLVVVALEDDGLVVADEGHERFERGSYSGRFSPAGDLAYWAWRAA